MMTLDLKDKQEKHSPISLTKILFITLFMFSQLCYAQNYVYIDTNTNDFSIGTITRYYGSNSPIHYMKTSDRTGKFLIFWNQILGYRTFPFSGYNVTDFTVLGDTAYICGEEPDGKGFYAWVDLAVNQFDWQFHIYSLYNSGAYITDLRRIRVFKINNKPQILLIGNYVNQNTNIPAVVHVKNQNECQVAYTGGEYFDDIVVLDNYIVTVARKGYDNPTNSPHFLRVLHKNNFTLSDTLFHKSYDWQRRSAKDRILLQDIVYNKFVSVYHMDAALYVNTFEVGVSGILQCHRYHTMPAVITDPIRDVEYNSYDATLMVIHSSDSVGIASKFRYTPADTLSWIWSRHPDMSNYCAGCYPLLMSTAKMSSNTNMVSGILHNKMVIWKTNNECVIPERYDLSNKATFIQYRITMPVILEPFILPDTTLNSHLNQTPFLEVCNRGKN